MNNKPQTEPVTLIVSMALTAMAVGLMNEYDQTLQKILITLLFIFSGEATIMLYWSIILPLIKAEFENSINSIKFKRKFGTFLAIIRLYFEIQLKIFFFRCTVTEIKLLGYISGFIAFLIFYIAIPIKLVISLID